MAIYTGIGGSAKSVSKIYTGVGGTARQVHKGYIGVDGVAKKFYDGGNPISSFALGTEFGISDPSGKNTYLVYAGPQGRSGRRFVRQHGQRRMALANKHCRLNSDR